MGLPGRRYPREVRDERRLLRVAGVRRGAHLLEEPLKTAAEHAEHAGRLFHPVGVGQAGGHEAKVARAEQTRGLLARPVLDEHAYLPVEDVERLVRVRVGVRRDDVAGGGLAGDDAELAPVSSPLSSTVNRSPKSFACSPSPRLRKKASGLPGSRPFHRGPSAGSIRYSNVIGRDYTLW